LKKKIRKIIRESQIIFVIHESQLLYELIWKIQDLIRRLERGESSKKKKPREISKLTLMMILFVPVKKSRRNDFNDKKKLSTVI
jgi:hypothetical protein